MKKNIMISLIVAILFVIVGLKYFNNKKVEVNNFSPQTGAHTVILDNIPVQFDLPQGYGVFTSSGNEGAYELILNIGKILPDGSLSSVAPTIYLRDKVMGDEKVFQPSEYVDFLIKIPDPEYKSTVMELFGNKAILIQSEADGKPTITGYLKGSQLATSFNGKDYIVIIDGTTYGTGKEFSQGLFDLIVSSIKIKR